MPRYDRLHAPASSLDQASKFVHVLHWGPRIIVHACLASLMLSPGCARRTTLPMPAPTVGSTARLTAPPATLAAAGPLFMPYLHQQGPHPASDRIAPGRYCCAGKLPCQRHACPPSRCCACLAPLLGLAPANLLSERMHLRVSVTLATHQLNQSPCRPLYLPSPQDAFVVSAASVSLDVSHRRVGALKARPGAPPAWCPAQTCIQLYSLPSTPCTPPPLANHPSAGRHPLIYALFPSPSPQPDPCGPPLAVADHPDRAALLLGLLLRLCPPHHHPQDSRAGQVRPGRPAVQAVRARHANRLSAPPAGGLQMRGYCTGVARMRHCPAGPAQQLPAAVTCPLTPVCAASWEPAKLLPAPTCGLAAPVYSLLLLCI